ncbi:MAG: ATP-dependent protease LonB, partial [Firmicutes bacterium]|nr:ATP-dependent protease LonB [Bacillota bacterium]
VADIGRYTPQTLPHIPLHPAIGIVNGLAVSGPGQGRLLEIEAVACRVRPGTGGLVVTGSVDEEHIGGSGHSMRRRSLVRSSIDNALTVLRQDSRLHIKDYEIHINFPGGAPIDGPSAGTAIAVAVFSAVTGYPCLNTVAVTGELSIHGQVKPVGGVRSKVAAAQQAGCRKVLVPKENFAEAASLQQHIAVIPVDTLEQALQHVLGAEPWTSGELSPDISGTAPSV